MLDVSSILEKSIRCCKSLLCTYTVSLTPPPRLHWSCRVVEEVWGAKRVPNILLPCVFSCVSKTPNIPHIILLSESYGIIMFYNKDLSSIASFVRGGT